MFMATLLILAAAQAAPAAAQPPTAQAGYFPPAFAGQSFTCSYPTKSGIRSEKGVILDDFESGWYSRPLRTASEPSLYQTSLKPRGGQDERLRFTWLRSFHPPVIVRIEMGQAPRLIATQLSGAGGYAPGTVEKRIDRALTSQEVANLRAVLSRTQVIAMAPRDCNRGMDGAEWIIEDVDSRGYHFIDRWSPEKGGVHELGLFLVGLTGWQIKDVY
jgi:hypothetical protein